MAPPRKKPSPSKLSRRGLRLPLDGLIEIAAAELDPHSLEAGRYRLQRTATRLSALRVSRDVIAGLLAARDALENHEYVPRGIAEWLSNGIGLYLSGQAKSLDSALGLSGERGRSPPLSKVRDDHARKARLGEMFHLHILGATIPQAATLVASVNPGVSVETLIDRYRRGGYSADRARLLALGMPQIDPADALSRYPDEPLAVAQAKAAILAMYAKGSI